MRSLFIFFFALCFNSVHASDGEAFFKKMYATHSGKWFTSLEFKQETKFFRNDSLLQTAVWHERANFPYELRIDRGEPALGNTTLYKKDSTYSFAKGKLQSVRGDTNPFIFFLGGMYHLPLNDCIQKLYKDGYDLSKSYETQWKGKSTYVLGSADATDSTSNQVWVDKNNLYVVRIMLKRGNNMLDVHLSDHVKLSRGWSETFVEFFSRGKLIQTEKYFDLKADVPINAKLFDANNYAADEN